MNAGRGIGMDIIKEKVDSIGGKIELSFEAGKFCEFKILLASIGKSNYERICTHAGQVENSVLVESHKKESTIIQPTFAGR
jgi:hypothetical protein